MNNTNSISSTGINQNQQVSRLYSIQPIGCGLPNVESLISYISRLSEAHCVPTGLLVMREIAPLVKPEYSSLGESRAGGLDKIFANQTRAVNGFGDWASGMVNAVEELTCRTDLSQLTLLSWQKAIPLKNLLKQQRAWCSICFEELLDNSSVLYEPLNWSLDVLKLCSKHKIPLSNVCPHCQKTNRPLSWHSRPGFCSKCREWLGASAYISTSLELRPKAVESEEQLHCIKCVNDLFCIPPDQFTDKIRFFIANHLCHFVEGVSSGKFSYLAQVLGTSITQVERWRKGHSTPTLGSMINICYKLKIDFPTLFETVDTEAIEKNYRVVETQKHANKKSTIHVSSRRVTQKQKLATSVLKMALLENPPPSVNDIAARLKYRTSSILYHYDSETCKEIAKKHKEFLNEKQSEHIREILERALNEYPPKPLEDVASESGIDSHTLKSYEKKLCRQVSNNYFQFRTQKKDKRVEKLFEEMKQIAQSLHSKGVRPTPSRIAPYLNTPRAILQVEPREKLEQFLQDNEWV
ncbi:TniQ family protein [Phormidium tenue]|uniref:TniQ domain-containing protein n=1 Tax=Phormidium tenue NIES-30 TaxID=549789 RepID=A0A1U7J916_9CYAN|nr:TniQ family protein [Phormidium tenue]MBD2230974.1 TniQ family protein [Phormidium tenue FACHB-1052]OKH49990.1 hypothetical protein NIES30_04580 [Phormidium tenue NIES-30]